ncbi:MAG: NAD(P)-binding protein [Syntrophobacteraceae bacterium]|nr:NAD(P)-binding protein [Syntrophobacteraceae bacterium]
MKDLISLFVPHSSSTTESNKTGSWRFLRPRYDEKRAPCCAACPAGEDIARIEMLTARGLFKEAWETILEENPFPAVCGRVCFHPCETKCNRREFDEGITIHVIERFLADTAARNGFKPRLKRFESRNRKVAVLGAGPLGLAAAWFLARLGYGCDVFESAPEPGGVLRYATPANRLPVSVLNAEIEQVRGAGFALYCAKPLTKAFLEEIRGGYDAVFIGCGKSGGEGLPVTGEEVASAEREGAPRLSGSLIVPGPPVIVYGGVFASHIKSVAHEVATGKEAAIGLDILFQKGPEAVLQDLESCRVGDGPSLSMEIYMGGPRCARNRHVVAFSEINIDHFQFAPKVAQPGLLRDESGATPAEIDLRISAGMAEKEAQRCFNCGLCNQCDNCRLYCPDLAVVIESGSGKRLIDYDHCKGCGICVVECPRNAMSLEKN